MVQRLLEGMQAVFNKVANFDKLQVTQDSYENPALFLNRLTEALIKYTKLDLESPSGTVVLATHFISQSAPDIQKKLKRAKEGPQTPIQDLTRMAFKVYNTHEETAEQARQAKLQRKLTPVPGTGGGSTAYNTTWDPGTARNLL